MHLSAIDAYNISLFLHISAVVVGFGSTFALAVAFPLALRMGTKHLPYIHELSLILNRWFVGPALLVILVTGIYQTSDADWGFGSFWISATFVIVIVLGGLGPGYFIPTDRKLGALARAELEAGGGGDVELSEDYQRQAQREGAMGALAGLLVLIAVFLMVTKPGA
jgi:uncharacterized membrane protein